jgi:hypothetical protein
VGQIAAAGVAQLTAVGHNPSAAPSARGSCAASKYAKETVRNQRKGLGIFCYITQNQVVATSCWFESGQGHQSEIVTLLCLFQQFEAHLKFWRGKHRVSTQLNLVPSTADGPFNIRWSKAKIFARVWTAVSSRIAGRGGPFFTAPATTSALPPIADVKADLVIVR